MPVCADLVNREVDVVNGGADLVNHEVVIGTDLCRFSKSRGRYKCQFVPI